MGDRPTTAGTPAVSNFPRRRGLLVSISDRVLTITLDNPRRLNALTVEMLLGLVEAVDIFESEDNLWLLVIRGSGDAAFCSGRDLAELADGQAMRPISNQPMKGRFRNPFETVFECKKPVIAGLKGWTLGAGLELALACDLRIASADARLGLPEAKRGLGANFGSNLLPRLIPMGVATEMLFLGDPIDALTARQWGLVNRVVEPNTFDEELGMLIEQVLQSAPLTLRRYKAVIRRGDGMPFSAALRLDPEPNVYDSEDRIEGVSAFLEQREPVWRAK